MIRPIDPAKLEATQKKLRDAFFERVPEPVNRHFALSLQGVSILRFRNRVFHVPPISYPAGLRMQEIFRRLEKIGKAEEDADVLKELLRALEDAAALCWSLCKPVSLVDRLFWRLLSNPLRDASQQEMGEILGFFSACRTRSTVRLNASEVTSVYERSISRMNSRSSSGISGGPRGSAPTAIPPPGSITNSARTR